MREVILKMSVSIDGFVGAADGSIGWLFDTHDEAAIAWTVETVSNASLHIMGSRTFRDMASWWPTSTEVFAPPMNQIPKAVFSRRGRESLQGAGTTKALKDAAARAKPGEQAELQTGAESWDQAYVASGPLAEEIAKLKAQDGKPIIAHGGAAFMRSLIAEDLIDTYALLVHPVALGKGLPIFSDLTAPRRLTLDRAIAFSGGAAAMIYRRA